MDPAQDCHTQCNIEHYYTELNENSICLLIVDIAKLLFDRIFFYVRLFSVVVQCKMGTDAGNIHIDYRLRDR